MGPRAGRHLVIFMRFPVAGGGKRRLARGIGTAGAVRFQRVRVRHLLTGLARDPRWTTWIAATPDGSGPWPSHVRLLYQGRGDLGDRLARVARRLPVGDVVMIGSDIPGISAADVADAFARLGAARAVFGPASDGGYWLVGLAGRPCRTSPFARVRWSSADTLADTIANVRGASAHRARVALLRALDDVDEAADLAACRSWARRITD
jgi:hypothetical protein